MATPFPFQLVAPERLLFSGPVEGVIVPAVEGEITVLANHAPLIALLRPGILTIDEKGTASRLFVNGGFAEVRPDGLTILAEHAVPVEEITDALIDAAIHAAQKEVDEATTDAEHLAASERLSQLREVRFVLLQPGGVLPGAS